MNNEKISPQQRANVRVCASCKWIYKGHRDCPKCGFASYGARWVYGDACYIYLKTQKPWMDDKLSQYTSDLLIEIETNRSL